MKPITSFGEAKKRLAEMQSSIADLNAFLTFADDTISKVNTLKGSSPDEPALKQDRPPATWGERVIELFKQTDNKPAMQKEIVALYEVNGWPIPAEPGELYRAISGAIAYLYKKKGILEKTEGGYRLKAV